MTISGNDIVTTVKKLYSLLIYVFSKHCLDNGLHNVLRNGLRKRITL